MIPNKLLDVVSGVVDKFIVDKDLKNTLKHEMEMSLHNANLAQIELNKAEAQHASIFVAGWRPCVGWICAIALGYHFILSPILDTILALSGYTITLPEFEFGQLSTILMGMLGLGGLRTFEKMKGVTKGN
jgi:hypothetical protein